MLSQIFINNKTPYIITKLTPKTIFFKPCKKLIEVSYNDDVLLYSIGERDIYNSFLPEAIEDAKTTKNLKTNFYHDIINYSIIDRVFKNGKILPENINIHNCEAIIDPITTEDKYKIKNKLLFLEFDIGKHDIRINKNKLETIQELRDIFETNPERITKILNTISNELIDIYKHLPAEQFNFLERYNKLCSIDRINFYINKSINV